MKKIYLLPLAALLLLTGLHANSQIAGSWKLVGPIQFPVNVSGQINGIGRIEQIKFDPMNPKRIYATSSCGGLFVSNDSAATWSSTGTDSLTIGLSDVAASICIDYTNDNILYLGTGDANYYYQNSGIWKSTDAGATWKASNATIGNRLAVEILMSPHNHNTLIAATNHGIWKSTDAGVTWTEKHANGSFTDMQFKPSPNTSTIYAATDSAFWVSTDVGETWKNIVMPLNTAALKNGGRIGVSKADSSVVYLTFVGDDNANCTPVLKSTNSGQSFTVIKPANTCDLNGYDTASLGSYYQGNYNYCLAVDPTNIKTLYIGAESIWKSTDGGVHWMTYYPWWAGVHPDMHYFAFNPTNSSILYNANDGGVWKTTDGSANWTAVSDGLSTSECYHAATSPIKKNFICSGLQDNGGIYLNNSAPWQTFQGGDQTGNYYADYIDSTTFYNLSANDRQQLSNSSQSLQMPFSKGNYDKIDFPITQTKIAYIADSDVYITKNLLSNPPTWKKILSIGSPVSALCSAPTNAAVLYCITKSGKFYYTANGLATTPAWTSGNTPAVTTNGACIAPLKSDTNVVYISCGSKVYRSANRGSTWTNVTANLPAVNIINMYNDIYSTNEAMYLATADAVWYKDNSMVNWLNFSKGLPSTCQITNMMMYNDGTSNSMVRVSFYGRGIWESPLYQDITTGINTYSNNAGLKVYPNPTNGKFTVTLQGIKGKATFEVFDLVGQCIYRTTLNANTTEINLNAHATGLYLYRVVSETGVHIGSGKLIVQ